MKAIVLGATGLTGNHLIDLLIEDTSFSEILVFTRRSLNKKHPKLQEHVVDLLHLENQEEIFKGDVVFCCIGTTKAKTPDQTIYKTIDYGIPVTATQLAKKNHIPKIVIISALGANSKSSIFYNRVKGEMQDDVLAQNIQETYILQPSLIVGDRQEKRKGEKIAEIFMKTIDFMTPAKYKMIQAKDIAKAMVYLAHHSYSDALIESDKIRELSRL